MEDITIENSQDSEEGMSEIWEFSLDEEEIEELIERLQELKQTKTDVEFDVDDENGFLIHYAEVEYEDSEEEEDE